MPLFLDIHRNVAGVTAEVIEVAHRRDLEVQHQFGVKLIHYWYDLNKQTAFCLMSGPNKEACIALHRASHGVMADEIFEVTEGVEPEMPLQAPEE
jgi:hypothetical protein